MKQHITNPFEKNENLTPFFEADERYLAAKNHNLNHYMKTHNTSKKQLNNQFSIFGYIKNHVALSIAAFILIAGTFSVAAAELLVPEQIKPSTIITSKKQSTPLPDEFSTTKNGLAFKYDKNLKFLTVEGTIQTQRACYDIISSEIIPTSGNSATTAAQYNLFLSTGITAETMKSGTISASDCEQKATDISIKQTFDLILSDDQLKEFDSLFGVKLSEAEFNEALLPSRPFQSDDAYGVTVFDACDLAIRHPKSIVSDGKSYPIQYETRSFSRSNWTTSTLQVGIFSNEYPGFEGIMISCTPVEATTSLDAFLDTQQVYIKKETLPRSEFCALANITPQTCAQLPETIGRYTGYESIEYVFKGANKVYQVRLDTQAAFESSGIQLNSLAPSTSTTPSYTRPDQIVTDPKPTNAQIIPMPATPSAQNLPKVFGQSVPQNHMVDTSVCGTESKIAISFNKNYLRYPRPNSQLFLPISFINRIGGDEFFADTNMNRSSLSWDCNLVNTNSSQVDTSTKYLTEYKKVGYAIKNGEIRNEDPKNLEKWIASESLSKVKNAKYIEIDNGTNNPYRLTAFEYDHFIVTIQYTPMPPEGDSAVKGGEFQLYLK